MSVTNINNITDIKSSVRIYPNPSADKINIELRSAIDFQNIELVIYDGIGREAGKMKIDKSVTVLEQNFPSGMYFYQVKDKNKTIGTGKFVKL